MIRKVVIIIASILYATAIACMYALYEFVKHCGGIPLWCCVIVTIILIGAIISSIIAGTILLDDLSS